MSGYSINQAHLIHDHSSGRSSTRLHAPPGGKNSMGTSFGWADDAAPPSRSGRARVGTSQSSEESSDSFLASPQRPQPPAASAVAYFPPANHLHEVPGPSSYLADMCPGANVMYTMRAGSQEEQAVIVDVCSDSSNSDGRRDNIRIKFQDGRERQTCEGKLRVIRVDYAKNISNSMANMAVSQQNNPYTSPEKASSSGMRYGSPALHQQEQYDPQRYDLDQEQYPQQQYDSPQKQGLGFGDSGKSSVRIKTSPGGNSSMGAGFGWGMEESSPSKKGDFQENKIGACLQPIQGGSTGELALGQVVMYKQTPRSEEVRCRVVDIELPSTNGAMRTKTYYKVQFEDGAERQTTIDKIKAIQPPIG